jgi:alpha-tubulin suppressor-like RCC1 family protein
MKYIYRGFALPTVLIASIVMMMVLLSGLSATTAISTSIKSQFNAKLLDQAADSGLKYMVNCISEGQVPTSGTWRPNSTSCSNSTANGSLSLYVTDASQYKTTFEVKAPVLTPDGQYYTVSAVGIMQLYGQSGNLVRTTKTDKNVRILAKAFSSSYSVSGSLISCAIVDTTSWCWGNNQDGRLGNSTIDSSSYEYEVDDGNILGLYDNGKPVRTPVDRTNKTGTGTNLLNREIGIAAGNGFGCAVTTTVNDNYLAGDRKAVCWGDQQNGQLGNNQSSGLQASPVATRKPWESVSPAQFPSANIVAQPGTACLVTERQSGDTSGNLWCWGRNNHGQLGQNTTYTNSLVPVRVYAINGSTTGQYFKLVNTSPDAFHICGITVNDRVVCWGRNDRGQSGGGDLVDPITLPRQAILSTDDTNLTASDIAVGGTNNGNHNHTCAIGNVTNNPSVVQGKIYCWGSNEFGELGLGSMGTSNWRRAQMVTLGLPSGYVATKVAASNTATCAVIKETASAVLSDLYCWGQNDNGQVGVGTTVAAYHTPQKVNELSGAMVRSLEGGAFRFCAVLNNSTYCWGKNHTGQLGAGFVSAFESKPTRAGFLQSTGDQIFF